MVNVESMMYVSTKNYEYDEVSMKIVAEKCQDYFALTQNLKSSVYSFVPIEKIVRRMYTGKMYLYSFENCFGETFDLQVLPECEFVTKRGYVPAPRLNDLDVVIDKSNLLCKINKRETIEGTFEVINTTIQYTYNYFCNGILIKGKI